MLNAIDGTALACALTYLWSTLVEIIFNSSFLIVNLDKA